ncbi:transcription repressor OFP8-like [Lolium rigidum]|uniref:transcription repressor OFP8-like n=1 Tax=Lolium rigidum TaxID=89674 RepID=UPI001F5C76A4|nr:transcription repressor OFP8-like [Lolium rigidum]
MSSSSARRGVGAGGGHFPVGRRRHVPVVDTGCSCRPRRPRVQLSLPSFLKPSLFASRPSASAGPARSNSSSSLFPSSSSTASFSTSYASSNCSNYYSSYHGFGAAPKKQEHLPAPKLQVPTAMPASPANKMQPAASANRKQKNRCGYVEKRAATAAEAEPEPEDVGLAVEKDSSDPRADFRESMVQMVVETGLCSWDDLRCMLRRLLALNSPRHHAAILTAFAELCAQLASPPPPAAAASSYHYNL